MSKTKTNVDQNPENEKTGSRYHLLDAYRGITIISMVLYHSCFDYFYAFGKDPSWISKRSSFLWQQSICCSFIMLSGMVWPLGRRNALKRGLILIGLGTLITLVTAVFIPEETINYGILTFMGIATLFMIPLDRLRNSKFGKNKSVLTELPIIIICLVLFILLKYLPNGYIGTRYHILYRFPDSLYNYPALIPFGLPTPDFRSGDYFPVIPWIFLYIIGCELGRILFNNETFKKAASKKIPVLSYLGTKSLLIYMIHQPVCYGIIWLICL
jgi:uncharacterized membrane protein